MIYCKCRNIGGTFNLAIEHKIAILKVANILAHTYNVIEMGCTITKLKVRNILFLLCVDEITKFSARQDFYVYGSHIIS